LLGREVFFTVAGHGYEAAKDGFGIRGVRVTPRAGEAATIKVKRVAVAERVARLTGTGRYRDTELLGKETPPPSPHPGDVAGQDSVQTAVYRGKVFWFWGDTLRLNYPLGLFRMAGATTPIPAGDFDPAALRYDYFVDPKTGFARAMMPLPERKEGVVWVFSLAVVPDAKGVEKLTAHYSRRKGLDGEFEQGITVYDDESDTFRVAKQTPLSEKWRRPNGHPVKWDDGGKTWLLYGSPNPNVRVPATYETVLDPTKYEAFTCAKPDGKPDRTAAGTLNWRWQADLPPTDSRAERAWLKANKIQPGEPRFLPAAGDGKGRVTLHSGSVRWNAFRKKWLLVAGRIDGDASHLGEVWVAEASSPTGPFPTAVRVAAHDKQTFYNVVQHDFLDQDGGKTVYFEGTYTNDFSGNPHKTPRYNYNQVLYKLDLDNPALTAIPIGK
jgi:hypothetical protein